MDKPRRPVGRPRNPVTERPKPIYHREPTISAEIRGVVRRMYIRGFSLQDIGYVANISKTSILKIVDEAGLERRRKRR